MHSILEHSGGMQSRSRDTMAPLLLAQTLVDGGKQ